MFYFIFLMFTATCSNMIASLDELQKLLKDSLDYRNELIKTYGNDFKTQLSADAYSDYHRDYMCTMEIYFEIFSHHSDQKEKEISLEQIQTTVTNATNFDINRLKIQSNNIDKIIIEINANQNNQTLEITTQQINQENANSTIQDLQKQKAQIDSKIRNLENKTTNELQKIKKSCYKKIKNLCQCIYYVGSELQTNSSNIPSHCQSTNKKSRISSSSNSSSDDSESYESADNLDTLTNKMSGLKIGKIHISTNEKTHRKDVFGNNDHYEEYHEKKRKKYDLISDYR